MPHAPSPTLARSLRLRVYLLGLFRLERVISDCASRPATRRRRVALHLPTRKTESLLAYLVLHPEPHPREQLAALLWGDVPDDLARTSLRRALVLLRQALGPDTILADRASIQLNPDLPLWVDAREFQTQAEEFLRSNPPDSALHLDLYQGDLLADFYDEWIEPRREHLRSLHLKVLLALAQQQRARGEYAHAIEFAHQVLHRDAANESAHQIIMFCHATLGQHADALQQFETCQRALREDLDIEPSPITLALVEWIKEQRTANPSTATRITNLPVPLTSFIGREREVNELKQLLGATRLLTLTGAGGCGKTRLAIQLGSQVADQFKDGVWWIELAGLREEALVPQAIAKTLGVREMPQQSLLERLTNFLYEKQLLLILDNCDHLLEACARVSETLLTQRPDLSVLATSRQSFDIAGERAWIVPSLSLPAAQLLVPERVDKETIAALGKSEAVRLFVDRARGVRTDFELTEHNVQAVTQICERLDGIPLALELAAARIRLLTAEHLAARLHDRFSLLRGGSRTALPRHQTLRACIDWSYDLLPTEARKVFRRLSVFMGGFTLEAAEVVCSDADVLSSAVLDQVSNLADRSLVNVEQQGGNARYRLLETIREYASDRLREAGEAEGTQERHLNFFIQIAEESEPGLRGREQFAWLARLEKEHDNLRAALRWSHALPRRIETGARLAASLWRFWEMRGYLSEGRQWLAKILAAPSADTLPTSVRAKALLSAGILAYDQGDYAIAGTQLQTSLALFRDLDDREGIALALNNLGRATHEQGNIAEARGFYNESLTLFQDLGDRPRIAWLLYNLGHLAEHQQDGLQAAALFRSSLVQFRELGDQRGIAWSLSGLGAASLHAKESTEALEQIEESVILFRELGYKQGLAYSLNILGDYARRHGQYRQAEADYRECLILFREIGDKRGMGWVLQNLGQVTLSHGDIAQAKELIEASLNLAQELCDQHTIVTCLAAESRIALRAGDALRAARLCGATQAWLEGTGARLDPADQLEFDHCIAGARTQLDENSFASVWAEGWAMTLEQAIEYALQS